MKSLLVFGVRIFEESYLLFQLLDRILYVRVNHRMVLGSVAGLHVEINICDAECRESTFATGEHDMPVSLTLLCVLLMMFQVFFSLERCQTELTLFAHFEVSL